MPKKTTNKDQLDHLKWLANREKNIEKDVREQVDREIELISTLQEKLQRLKLTREPKVRIERAEAAIAKAKGKLEPGASPAEIRKNTIQARITVVKTANQVDEKRRADEYERQRGVKQNKAREKAVTVENKKRQAAQLGRQEEQWARDTEKKIEDQPVELTIKGRQNVNRWQKELFEYAEKMKQAEERAATAAAAAALASERPAESKRKREEEKAKLARTKKEDKNKRERDEEAAKENQINRDQAKKKRKTADQSVKKASSLENKKKRKETRDANLDYNAGEKGSNRVGAPARIAADGRRKGREQKADDRVSREDDLRNVTDGILGNWQKDFTEHFGRNGGDFIRLPPLQYFFFVANVEDAPQGDAVYANEAILQRAMDGVSPNSSMIVGIVTKLDVLCTAARMHYTMALAMRLREPAMDEATMRMLTANTTWLHATAEVSGKKYGTAHACSHDLSATVKPGHRGRAFVVLPYCDEACQTAAKLVLHAFLPPNAETLDSLKGKVCLHTSLATGINEPVFHDECSFLGTTAYAKTMIVFNVDQLWEVAGGGDIRSELRNMHWIDPEGTEKTTANFDEDFNLADFISGAFVRQHINSIGLLRNDAVMPSTPTPQAVVPAVVAMWSDQATAPLLHNEEQDGAILATDTTASGPFAAVERRLRKSTGIQDHSASSAGLYALRRICVDNMLEEENNNLLEEGKDNNSRLRQQSFRNAAIMSVDHEAKTPTLPATATAFTDVAAAAAAYVGNATGKMGAVSPDANGGLQNVLRVAKRFLEEKNSLMRAVKAAAKNKEIGGRKVATAIGMVDSQKRRLSAEEWAVTVAVCQTAKSINRKHYTVFHDETVQRTIVEILTELGSTFPVQVLDDGGALVVNILQHLFAPQSGTLRQLMSIQASGDTDAKKWAATCNHLQTTYEVARTAPRKLTKNEIAFVELVDSYFRLKIGKEFYGEHIGSAAIAYFTSDDKEEILDQNRANKLELVEKLRALIPDKTKKRGEDREKWEQEQKGIIEKMLEDAGALQAENLNFERGFAQEGVDGYYSGYQGGETAGGIQCAKKLGAAAGALAGATLQNENSAATADDLYTAGFDAGKAVAQANRTERKTFEAAEDAELREVAKANGFEGDLKLLTFRDARPRLVNVPSLVVKTAVEDFLRGKQVKIENMGQMREIIGLIDAPPDPNNPDAPNLYMVPSLSTAPKGPALETIYQLLSWLCKTPGGKLRHQAVGNNAFANIWKDRLNEIMEEIPGELPILLSVPTKNQASDSAEVLYSGSKWIVGQTFRLLRRTSPDTEEMTSARSATNDIFGSALGDALSSRETGSKYGAVAINFDPLIVPMRTGPLLSEPPNITFPVSSDGNGGMGARAGTTLERVAASLNLPASW
jgi:hypothetical protein